MDDNVKQPPPPPPCSNVPGPVVFRCHVDRRMYVLPIVMWSIFVIAVLIGAPTMMWGLFGAAFSAAPLALVLYIGHSIWSHVTYTVDGKALRVSSPLRSMAIDIGRITKIRRGKFWVERERNYSAAYVKLRIMYDKYTYIYVSPENEEAFVRLLQSINPDIAYSSERNL